MPADVRAFFVSLTQVLLLTAAILVLTFWIIKPDPDHYFAGSMLQTRLLENTPSPRIILAGGSNVAMGIDAQLMQRTLGIPVINDGLHAGLGLAPLQEVQAYIHKGDVIIISLEYNLFANQEVMNGDPTFLSDWIEYSSQRIHYLSYPWKEAPGIYAIMLQRKVNRQVNSYLFGGSLSETRKIFTGTKFDANGDFIGHLQTGSTEQEKIPNTPYPVLNLQEDIFVFLRNFNRIAHEKGAEVYFEAPASRQRNCKATGETQMANFIKRFAERSSIPVLTRPEEVCLPNRYFFDSEYHLNAEGRTLRTERLLKDWLRVTAESR